MNLNSQINKSQHAYLIEGDREKVVAEIKNSLKEIFGAEMDGNPDFRISFFESMGVDEARELKEEQSRMAFAGREKFFVVGADAITREAQNALLKVFEEPTEGTYLFLIVPSIRQILPTLLSRVRVIRAESGKRKVESYAEAEEFFAVAVEKRLSLPFVKKLIEEKEKQPVISFLNALESVAREKLPASKMTKADAEFFEELIKCRGYSGDRSSAVKMLLEHIALVAPVIAK